MQQNSSGGGQRQFRVEWAHLAVVGVVGLLAAGVFSVCCRGPVEHDHEQGPGHDDHVHIDPVEQDPQVAATSALTVLFSWDPARQSGPGDVPAGVAEELFTGSVAADVQSGRAVVDRSVQWGDWATAHARVMALVPDTRVIGRGSGPDRTVLAEVEQTLVYPDGGRSRLADRQIRVHLVVSSGRWKADRVDVADADQQQQQQKAGEK